MVFSVNGFEDITGPVLISTTIHKDKRGSFSESYRKSFFDSNILPLNFVQDNLVFSGKNVLRGLHYQLNPIMQGKLVSAVLGQIFDVAVDIRKNSSTYGKWISVFLSEGDGQMFYVPEGFAHGYCTLAEKSIVSYKTTNEFAPELDRGIKWDDEFLNIQWPIEDPIVSGKDSSLPAFFDDKGLNLHSLTV